MKIINDGSMDNTVEDKNKQGRKGTVYCGTKQDLWQKTSDMLHNR